MAKLPKISKLNTSKKSTPKPNVHVTKSGKKIKLQQSFLQRYVARRDKKELRKAELLRDMPKDRFKRILYRLNPKRQFKYWFSKDGGIMALKLIGIGFVACFILVLGVFAYFRKDLPDLKDISGDNIGGSIRYYDKTGQTLLWEDYDAVKRNPVQSDQMSQFLKDATVAVEDREFFKHGGFDVRGITRAGIANVTGGSTSQGGSTITQQLVKLTQDWTKDRTYTRKIKELILSVELERSYSKDEILAGYLNAAPYGDIQYGVEAASRDYFQKSAKDLTLDEAAFMAAIPKSPSYYSPYGPYFEEGGREALVDRIHYALDVMQETGKITTEQRDEAKKVDVVAKVKQPPRKYAGITAPYFVLAAKEQLQSKFAQTYKRGGWKVTTTLDMDKQKIAEEQVAKGMPQVRRQGGNVAAFVSEEVATGQVVALVGGPDFNNETYGENNFARLPISPGSSFKAYDYTALMEHSTTFGAGSVLYDTQGALPGYPCTNKALPERGGNCLFNFSRTYSGPVTLRYALGGSRNIPAVKAMLIAGVDKTIDVANKLMDTDSGNAYGYRCYPAGTTDLTGSNQSPCFGSSAIGDGAYLKLDEHVHGYASLSRNGLNIPQTYILKVIDDANKTIDEWKPKPGNQVVRPDSAYILGDMLSDPNASYFSSPKPQRFKGKAGEWKFSLKTGTTNDAKDGLLLGYTTKYATGVWVGYHDHTRAMTGSMENMTLPIWQGYMRAIHTDVKPEERVKPSGVQTLPAYVITSHVGFGSVEPSQSTDLYPSWYQNKNGTSNKKQTIDIISNKQATECTPDLAKKELSTAGPAAFSGDTFVPGGANATSAEKDDIHLCTDSKPSISVSATASSGNTYGITATIGQGTHQLSGNGDKGGGKLEILVNGEVVQSFDVTNDNLNYTISYTPTTTGQNTISAKIVDSVLYSATSSSQEIAPFALSQTSNAANVIFNWTATGSVNVYTTAGVLVCTSATGTCSKAKALLPVGTTVYASSVSDSSPTITTSGY